MTPPPSQRVEGAHHVLDDIREEATAVLSNGMVCNNTLDRVRALVTVLAVELLAQLPVLACKSE